MYYLAGPMSGYPDLNRQAFHDARRRWENAGIAVVSPVDLMPPEENAATPVREFIERDIAALACCVGILMLPGWQASKGAVAEFFCARWLGLPAFDAETGQRLEFPFTSPIAPGPEYSASLEEAQLRQAGDEQADGFVSPSFAGPGVYEPEPKKLRHRGSERFHQLLREIGDLHDRKQADYGTDTDPFANVRATQQWGVPAWVGALVRLNDKVVRLQQFARRGSLYNESAMDSMLDIAVYALIAYVLYEEACQQEETAGTIPSAGYRQGSAASAMVSGLTRGA